MKLPALIFVPPALGLDVLAAAAFSVDQNLFTFCVVLVATVGVVAAVIQWIDNRIEHKLKTFQTVMLLRHDIVLKELQNVKEIVTTNLNPHESEHHTRRTK